MMLSAKSILSIAALTFTLMTSAGAADSRFIASLSKLDPQTRLEQVCDLAAVNHIGKKENLRKPDRAKANVITAPKVRGDTIEGTGGAFRSGGKWYAFSFTCKGSPDHLKVLSFTYRVGELIPKSKWPEYGLWD
jgi:hypothetical protein